jgi:hypothetical protein
MKVSPSTVEGRRIRCVQRNRKREAHREVRAPPPLGGEAHVLSGEILNRAHQ